MWQVRHTTAGVFMGVSHGKGHYSNISECCRGLGVFKFRTAEEIDELFRTVVSPRLPPNARMDPRDLSIEEWNPKLNELLEDEGVVEAAQYLSGWILSTFPCGLS